MSLEDLAPKPSGKMVAVEGKPVYVRKCTQFEYACYLEQVNRYVGVDIRSDKFKEATASRDHPIFYLRCLAFTVAYGLCDDKFKPTYSPGYENEATPAFCAAADELAKIGEEPLVLLLKAFNDVNGIPNSETEAEEDEEQKKTDSNETS